MRRGLPLLQSGQAQKEVTHNEALSLLDLAVQAVVETVGDNAPPAAPTPGACWIVGAAPTGAWTGAAHALAGWSASGWRFVAPRAGMSAWSRGDDAMAHFDGAGWVVGTLSGTRLVLGGAVLLGPPQPGIAAPASGATVDAEARSAIGAILAALRAHGLVRS
uniref:DUF2793 domain-containing protein n=1 Tax=uncultured Sphingomonas sp. TaxID=158754 RepID=UPI0035CC549E